MRFRKIIHTLRGLSFMHGKNWVRLNFLWKKKLHFFAYKIRWKIQFASSIAHCYDSVIKHFFEKTEKETCQMHRNSHIGEGRWHLIGFSFMPLIGCIQHHWRNVKEMRAHLILSCLCSFNLTSTNNNIFECIFTEKITVVSLASVTNKHVVSRWYRKCM